MVELRPESVDPPRAQPGPDAQRDEGFGVSPRCKSWLPYLQTAHGLAPSALGDSPHKEKPRAAETQSWDGSQEGRLPRLNPCGPPSALLRNPCLGLKPCFGCVFWGPLVSPHTLICVWLLSPLLFPFSLLLCPSKLTCGHSNPSVSE